MIFANRKPSRSILLPLFFIFSFGGCSSDLYTQQIKVIEAIVRTAHTYSLQVSNAHGKNEIIFAINTFRKQIGRLHKKFIRLSRHTVKKNEKPPVEYLNALRRLKEADTRINETMNKVSSYASDPDVQKALIRLAEITAF